jgi:hypothetical protein
MLTASLTPARPARLVVALLALITASATQGLAQDAVPPGHPSIRGTLAMRFGEAASAFRTGRPVWIRADTAFPHVVRGVYGNLEEAQLESPEFPLTLLSGPYVTPPDFGRESETGPICWHTKRPRYSRYICAGAMGFPAFNPAEIESITLTVTTIDERSYNLTFPAGEVDAFFIGVSAFDRFAAPYYAQFYGLEYAMQIRDSIIAPEAMR